MTFVWAVLFLFSGAVLGMVALCIVTAGGGADDWNDGYRAGLKKGSKDK